MPPSQCRAVESFANQHPFIMGVLVTITLIVMLLIVVVLEEKRGDL